MKDLPDYSLKTRVLRGADVGWARASPGFSERCAPVSVQGITRPGQLPSLPARPACVCRAVSSGDDSLFPTTHVRRGGGPLVIFSFPIRWAAEMVRESLSAAPSQPTRGTVGVVSLRAVATKCVRWPAFRYAESGCP